MASFNLLFWNFNKTLPYLLLKVSLNHIQNKTKTILNYLNHKINNWWHWLRAFNDIFMNQWNIQSQQHPLQQNIKPKLDCYLQIKVNFNLIEWLNNQELKICKTIILKNFHNYWYLSDTHFPIFQQMKIGVQIWKGRWFFISHKKIYATTFFDFFIQMETLVSSFYWCDIWYCVPNDVHKKFYFLIHI